MIDPARRLQYLRAMGIDVWVERTGRAPRDLGPVIRDSSEPERTSSLEPGLIKIAPAGSELVTHHASRITAPTEAAAFDWSALEVAVKACTLCELHRTRTQTVFGVGNRQAEWMVIGEAPGADEDRQGEPFVGRAGQLLNSMLMACGLKREQVFIANILKCRPPNNRDPAPNEAGCCTPYLQRQIELVNPKLILCVGRIAAQNLLNTDTPIGKLRGQVHRLGASRRPVVVTYHPAYLLRSPGEKRRAWEDLLLAMRTLGAASG